MFKYPFPTAKLSAFFRRWTSVTLKFYGFSGIIALSLECCSLSLDLLFRKQGENPWEKFDNKNVFGKGKKGDFRLRLVVFKSHYKLINLEGENEKVSVSFACCSKIPNRSKLLSSPTGTPLLKLKGKLKFIQMKHQLSCIDSVSRINAALNVIEFHAKRTTREP